LLCQHYKVNENKPPGQHNKRGLCHRPYSLAGLLMGAYEAAMATILNEKILKQLCNFTTEVIEKYIRMLISAGAELICILEPTAVMLGPDQFEKYSASHVKHINESFTKGSGKKS